MMAERGINVGRELPQATEVMDFPGMSDIGGDASAKLFDPSSIFGQGYMPPELSDASTGAINLLNPAQQRAKSLYESGVYADPDYTAQQGGYIPQYQMGGLSERDKKALGKESLNPLTANPWFNPRSDIEMRRHTENLREKYGMEDELSESYDWQKSPFEKKYEALKASEESEVESSRLKALAELGGMGHAESARESEGVYQQSLGDMDRGNIQSLLGLIGGAKDDIQMGPWNPTKTGRGRTLSQAFSGPENRGYKIGMHTPDIRGDIDVEETMARRNYPSPLPEITLPGYDTQRSEMMSSLGMQMGGMMPGGVSNPLPYNLGGSVAQQPMAYQLGGLLKYRRSPFG